LGRFTERSESPRAWLGLGEASALLGVSPQTLRRWSDAGQVHVYTTPGGHRRFHRAALERLIPRGPAARRSCVGSGLSPARLARAYRRGARDAGRELTWIGALSPEQRDWFRVRGRRLAEVLLAHLDATDEEARRHQLVEGTAEAAAYGRMAADLGLSLGQAVEGFLQFRRPFLHELALLTQRRGFDADQASSLLERAEHAMDRLLIATMTAQSVGSVGHGRGA
jgi:excisionase family DNA binding protein